MELRFLCAEVVLGLDATGWTLTGEAFITKGEV